MHRKQKIDVLRAPGKDPKRIQVDRVRAMSASDYGIVNGVTLIVRGPVERWAGPER